MLRGRFTSRTIIPRRNSNSSSSTTRMSSSSVSAPTATAAAKKWGFDISDKVAPELAKGTDVWSVFSPAAGHVPKDSLNLGQGFQNWAPPKFIRDSLSEALASVEGNHYSLPRGRIRLRNALSKYLSESYKLEEGRKLDPNTEIIVTAGANEGMFAWATAFIQPGDEVILFEPYFDQYVAQILFNGGVPVYVPIRAPAAAAHSNVSAAEWKIDLEEFKQAITPKTKAVWINTPHNPIGKVFEESELRDIGKIAEEHDLMILSDEVYDCLTLNGKPHVRIAALDDFWKRTVTVGSVGKSFAATGWRVGWCVGPAQLITPVLAASTRIVFCVNSPAQEAAGAGIEQALENGFFDTQRQEYEERKKVLLEGLDELGLPYTIPDGAYFALINIERLQVPSDFPVPDMIKDRPRDWKAAWFVAQTAGVVMIPPTEFMSDGHIHLAENFLRIAFCKDLDTLKEAPKRLLKLKPYIKDI